MGTELALDLEQAQVEAHLPGAVDIIARQAGTSVIVVIKNQLELSDDSHLLRLLGYTTNAEANILVRHHAGKVNCRYTGGARMSRSILLGQLTTGALSRWRPSLRAS